MMQEKPEGETFRILRQSVREFVRKEVLPLAVKIDQDDYFPVDVFRKMGAMGYLGVTIPPEYGGSGLGYLAQAIVEEELGYASASLALSYGAHSNLCLDNLFRNGSEKMRKEFVPRLCSGEWIGSLCLTEPGSGSDALAMKTTATRNGGGFVISGSKTLITNAPYADLLLVYAKTDAGFTPFVLLGTDKGVTRGKKFDKMGMRGSPTGELFFDAVSVGQDRIVGSYAEGRDVILSGLNSERVILSFIFIGLARRAMELAIRYSTERKQSGKEISEFQLIQEKLAYMYTRYETSRLLAYEALEAMDRDRMDVIHSAAAILHAAESAEYVAREAIQIMGGIGYIKDSEVERLLRDAILGQIGAGTTEIRKRLIAKELVKLYRKDNNFLGEDEMR